MRTLLVAGVAVAVLVAGHRARARPTRPAACPRARYVVAPADGVRLGLVEGGPGLLDFTGRTIALPGCPPARAIVRARRAATLVRAAWRRCGVLRGVRLAARIARDGCGVLEGSLRAKRRPAARFQARRSACGDGAVDARSGETCDGTQGCQPGAACRSCACMPAASATTTTTAPPTTTTTLPPSSQGLIAEALEAGRIDYGTSLVYRTWALFWDPRLPAEFDGDGSTGEDLRLFFEARRHWDSLSPEVRDALTPYVLHEPQDPRSAFGPLSAPLRAPRAAGQTDTRCRTKWVSELSAGGHFRGWLCGSGDPATDAGIFAKVLPVAEALWPAMTQPPPNGMGAPFSIGNPIAIHILDTGQCRPRGIDDECKTISGTGVAAALTTEPQSGTRSNGYLLVSRNRLGDAGKIKSDLAHEFFHVLQFAHNVDVVEDTWFTEASATWAEFFYARQTSRREVHWRFTNVFQALPMSLLSHGLDHDYAAYIWPFFVQQETGSPAAVFQAWASGAAAADAGQFMDAIDAQLPFEEHFRDFAVRNVNQNLPGNPLGTRYVAQDGQFPDGVWPKALCPDPAAQCPLVTELRAGTKLTLNPSLAPLLAVYAGFSLPEEATRHLTLDFSGVAPAERRDVDVLARATGSQEWKRIRVAEGALKLCRDRADQDVDRLIVILGNHDKDPNASLGGEAKIEAKAACGYPQRLGLEFSVTDAVRGTGTSSDTDYTANATFVLDEEMSDIPVGQFVYTLERVSGSVRATGTYPGANGGTCSGHGTGAFSHDDAVFTGGSVTIERDPDDRTLGRFGVGISGVFSSTVPMTWTCPGEDPRTEEGAISLTLTSDPREFRWGSWSLGASYTVEQAYPHATRRVDLTLTGGDFVEPD